MLHWLQLLLCLVVIGYAGYYLSRYGDIIAEKTGMSSSWVGLILLSAAVKGYLPASSAVMMSALVVVGLVFRPQRRVVLGLTWVSLGLLMLYVLNSWVIFEHAHSP